MSKDWIPLGAHLHSPRFGYEHHGIYVGLDRVIHHAGYSEAFKKGSIEDTSLKEFCAGNGYSIRRYEAPATRNLVSCNALASDSKTATSNII